MPPSRAETDGRQIAGELADRLGRLTADLPAVDSRLVELVDARRQGFSKATVDAAAGRQVFLKVCAACHQLGDQARQNRPRTRWRRLLRGLDRLVEDTLDPSRNAQVDQAFPHDIDRVRRAELS